MEQTIKRWRWVSLVLFLFGCQIEFYNEPMGDCRRSASACAPGFRCELDETERYTCVPEESQETDAALTLDATSMADAGNALDSEVPADTSVVPDMQKDYLLRDVETLPSCDDGITNGDETDLDCGGNCQGCLNGTRCRYDSDCAANRCTDGICQDPYCGDGLMNDGEDCDDGNQNAEDGCSPACTIEPGWACDTGSCERVPEVCDDIDNDADGQIDENCDADGDGFCHSDAIVIGTPAVCPEGNTDCCDTDENVFPGQEQFFTTRHNCATFDYNCDGTEERRYTGLAGDCSFPDCDGDSGWASDIPPCGNSSLYLLCNGRRNFSALACEPDEEIIRQSCR